MNNHTDKPSKVTDLDCEHQWVSNSGVGGEPDFRMSRQMSAVALMHVKCFVCGDRTWFTKQQWEALPYTSTESPDAKPSESPTPRTDLKEALHSLFRRMGQDFDSLLGNADMDTVKEAANRIEELERELATMTRYRDMNNAELGRMTEKCNALQADLASAIANHAADLSAQSAIAPRWTPTYRGEEDGSQTWVAAPPPCWLLLDDVLHPDRTPWVVYWDGVGYPVNCTSYRVIGYYQTPLPPRDSVCGPVDGGGQHG